MTTAALSDRDVERIAWTVLIVAFVAFLAILIGVPAVGYWYVVNATDSHESTLTVLSGTVIVEMQGRDPTAEQRNRLVPEGSTIRTDANTRVNLNLFDGSTVIVFPDTQVTLSEIRSPKFAMSNQPLQAHLILHSGRLRLDVASNSKTLDMRVLTPQGESQFDLGSYLVEVNNDRTDVIVREGQAFVRARNQMVPLSTRQRTLLKTNEPPSAPLPAERDLIAHGTFDTFQDAWTAYNDQGGDGGDVDGAVTVEIDPLSGRRIVHFSRKGSNGNHVDTGIEQVLNKDVTDAEVIRFRADVRVNFQSLSGGGYLSSEYPLMVKIRYRDVKGGENIWVHGFYYQNEARNPTANGEQIPQGLWYPYESEDLTDILNPRPARIISIQIFASGWDFDSMVSDVGLTVE